VVPLRSTNRARWSLPSKFEMGLGACSYAMAACVVETKFLGIYIQRDETQTGQWQLRPQATVYNSRGKIAWENYALNVFQVRGEKEERECAVLLLECRPRVTFPEGVDPEDASCVLFSGCAGTAALAVPAVGHRCVVGVVLSEIRRELLLAGLARVVTRVSRLCGTRETDEGAGMSARGREDALLLMNALVYGTRGVPPLGALERGDGTISKVPGDWPHEAWRVALTGDAGGSGIAGVSAKFECTGGDDGGRFRARCERAVLRLRRACARPLGSEHSGVRRIVAGLRDAPCPGRGQVWIGGAAN
jgi:hypothetical protein